MKNEGERGGKMKGRKNQKKEKMKKWSEKGWGVRTEELPIFLQKEKLRQ